MRSAPCGLASTRTLAAVPTSQRDFYNFSSVQFYKQGGGLPGEGPPESLHLEEERHP